MNGSLSINPDTIGHSEVCHLIQDCGLEHQFFELIINLASLQPIAEDRLETEDLSLRQAPAMIVALPLPLFAASFSDAPSLASRACRSAFVFACCQIFAPLRGGMAAFLYVC